MKTLSLLKTLSVLPGKSTISFFSFPTAYFARAIRTTRFFYSKALVNFRIFLVTFSAFGNTHSFVKLKSWQEPDRLLVMGSRPLVTLILGHSFVRRLRHDLETGFDQRAKQNFNLDHEGTASVFMHGVGGRTVLFIYLLATRERVDSNGFYGRWRLHLMGS